MEKSLQELSELITILLDEKRGCPWDRKQTSIMLCKYIVDEVYELVDAVHNNDMTNIIEEYGDVIFLLFMILHVFSKERKTMLEESLHNVIIKMKHRHPYVFSETPVPKTEEEFIQIWEEQKRKEKEKGKDTIQSRFSSIPSSLPPFIRAIQICKKAPHSLYASSSATYVQYEEALKNNNNIEEAFTKHFYALLEDAKKHTIDIQSLLVKENNAIIRNLTK
ncbi:MAG: MazG nucleotide pyrophosphohydrolase domain-containing protein [Desulfovibrionaceae bacterium]